MTVQSKLELSGKRITITVDQAVDLLRSVFVAVGCSPKNARAVAEHLVDANLSGVESHGMMRALQYIDQFESGYMKADVEAKLVCNKFGGNEVDGCGGIGIPAMRLATAAVCKQAKDNGIAAIAIRNVGHTGRIGAFAQQAANEGMLAIIIGGGGRENWRQVAPYGGCKALLPTNPYSIAIPGGLRGPVVLDFATSKIAGGWVYAAQSAGALLPNDVLINSHGQVSRNPQDYFDGGAILPAGGAKGYAMAVVAEVLAEAMLGPATTECNWLMIALDCERYREPHTMQIVAEQILEELRQCPPAPGFEKVEVPGERERGYRNRTEHQGVSLPDQTWQQIQQMSVRLNAR